VYKIARVQIYLILALALFLQGGMMNYFEVLGAKPDLLLIAVIFFGLFLGPVAGLESGFAAGLAKDVFALDFFWVNAVLLGITGFLVGIINTQISKESKRVNFVFVILFTIFSMSLHYLLAVVLSRSVALGFAEFFISSIIPTAIYTGLVSVPIYANLISIYKLKETEEYL